MKKTKNPTKADRLLAALEAFYGMRLHEVKGRSTKYRVFQHPDRNPGDGFFYIGKAGALRAGRTIGESVSLESFAKRLLAKTEKEG